MELKRTDLKGYRRILKESLIESDRLYSISTLPPERWIKENHKGSTYRNALFSKIYDDNDNKFEIKRITIVNDKKHFDNFFQEPIVQFTSSLKNRFYKYYYDRNNIPKKEEQLIKQVLRNLKKEKSEILKDIFAVFATIHSSLDNSKILWKNGRILYNMELLTNCLGDGDTAGKKDRVTEFDELLIYSKKVLRVKHSEDPFDPSSNDTVEYIESEDCVKYIEFYDELFDEIGEKYCDDCGSYGCSLRNYVEKVIDDKDFWKNYKNWEKLNESLRKYVEKFFANYRTEINRNTQLKETELLEEKIVEIQNKIFNIIDQKNKPQTSEKVFNTDIDPEKLKSQIKDITELSQLEEILSKITNMVTTDLYKYFKKLYNG